MYYVNVYRLKVRIYVYRNVCGWLVWLYVVGLFRVFDDVSVDGSDDFR